MRPTRLFRSTSFRIALIYLCLFSATMLVLFGVIYWRTAGAVSRQIEATIDAEITGLAEQYQQRGTMGLIHAIERRADRAKGTGGLYLLVDPTGKPLTGNLNRWPDTPAGPDGWVTFRLGYPGGKGPGINFGRARIFTLRGGLRLLVGHDIRERVWVNTLLQRSLLWGFAITVGLSLIGSLLLSRSVLARIDAINDTSQEIMAGDLARRVPVRRRNDEFDRLAGNLNAMLDQNERLLAGMKQVTDNIAHDLRTPLGHMRNRLETIAADPSTTPSTREAIEDAIADADGLLRTFNALLSIARAEAGEPRKRFEPVALATVLTDVVELYEPLAEERGITLTTETEGAVTIRGARELLFQALANLIDNAIKYAPEGGTVRVALTEADGRPAIAVHDDGPGIAEAQRGNVVRRFYRLEASRNTPGSGLGLSLVAAVARLHDAELVLDDNHPGLVARILFPGRIAGVSATSVPPQSDGAATS